jgi:hypothetical protein
VPIRPEVRLAEVRLVGEAVATHTLRGGNPHQAQAMLHRLAHAVIARFHAPLRHAPLAGCTMASSADAGSKSPWVRMRRARRGVSFTTWWLFPRRLAHQHPI